MTTKNIHSLKATRNLQNLTGASPRTPKTHQTAGVNSTENTRKYHIIAINEKTGKKTYMTAYPATHKEACTMLSKISKHPARRVQLEQI